MIIRQDIGQTRLPPQIGGRRERSAPPQFSTRKELPLPDRRTLLRLRTEGHCPQPVPGQNLTWTVIVAQTSEGFWGPAITGFEGRLCDLHPALQWWEGALPWLALTTDFITTTGSAQSFSVPADWNSASNTVEGIGCGGSGFSASRGPGGGGGAYAIAPNVTLTPSGTASYNIGTAGNNVDTMFVNTSTLVAKAGITATVTGTSPAGGAAGSCFPTTGAFSGGAGGAGSTGVNNACGGGGAAGPDGAGKAGGNTAFGNSGSGGGGSDGGTSTAGAAPTGLNTSAAGGNGKNGTGAGAAAGGNATALTGGGGGGSITSSGHAGSGATGIASWTQTVGGQTAGAGGGGGGASGSTTFGGTGGLYGGGGGGVSTGTVGVGAQGIIVASYTPSVASGTPFTNQWFTTTRSAWEPADPTPTKLAQLIQAQGPTTNGPIGIQAWFSTILNAWQAPDPQPTLPPRLIPPPAAATVPYAQVWFSTVYQAWTLPDPLPTLPRSLAQTTKIPYAPAWLGTVETAWVPPAPLPTLTQKLVQPQGATTNGANAPKWLSAVLSAWTPPDPLPTLNQRLVQPQGQTTNTPYAPAWLSTVEAAWVPPDPLPTLPIHLPQPFIAAVVSYAPKWLSAVLTAWAPPDPLPTLTLKLVQPQGATTNTPYAPAWFSAVETAWAPPDPLPTLPIHLPQPLIVPGAAFAPKWLSAVLSAWIPPDPLPTLTAKLVQPQGATTNSPYAPGWLASVLQTWASPDPVPTLTAKLPQAFVTQNVPYAPKWLSGIETAWVPPAPLPTLTSKLVQPQGATTNTPYAPAWLSTVLKSWTPADPQPTLTAKLAQSTTTATPYAPKWLSTVLDAWTSLAPPPTLGAKLAQAAQPQFRPHLPSWFGAVYEAWLESEPYDLPTLQTHLDFGAPPPVPSGFVPFGVMYGAELLVQIWRPYEDPLPVIPRYRIPIGIPPTPLYAPGVGGLGQGQGTPTAASNLAGLMAVSDDETISFQLYVRWVLPLDGYVFWLGTGAPVVIKGSLHVSIDKRQQEDETISVNRVVFTTAEHVQRFNEIAPGQVWVGQYGGLRFAFSASGPRYKSAGLYHYNGDAVYPAMANLLVPVGQELPKDTLIVSNSLPMWLTLKAYTPIWLNPPNPLITLYPSFALPDNLEPPYGVVHIEPGGTDALQMAPSFGPTRPIGWTALGTVFGDTNDSTHQQLASDRVSITLYGTTNNQALDFLDLVNRYSYDQDAIGIMSVTAMRDEKRTQRELGVLAMKKTIEYRVSYYQTRANAVAQQLIKHAHVSVFEFPNLLSP